MQFKNICSQAAREISTKLATKVHVGFRHTTDRETWEAVESPDQWVLHYWAGREAQISVGKLSCQSKGCKHTQFDWKAASNTQVRFKSLTLPQSSHAQGCKRISTTPYITGKSCNSYRNLSQNCSTGLFHKVWRTRDATGVKHSPYFMGYFIY